MTTRPTLSPRQQQNVRDNIKSVQIVAKLNAFVLGEELNMWNSDEHAYVKSVPDMTPAQLKAAEILLNRAVPTLTSTVLEIKEELPQDEQAIKERIARLIQAHPELVAQAGYAKMVGEVVETSDARSLL